MIRKINDGAHPRVVEQVHSVHLAGGAGLTPMTLDIGEDFLLPIGRRAGLIAEVFAYDAVTDTTCSKRITATFHNPVGVVTLESNSTAAIFDTITGLVSSAGTDGTLIQILCAGHAGNPTSWRAFVRMIIV